MLLSQWDGVWCSEAEMPTQEMRVPLLPFKGPVLSNQPNTNTVVCKTTCQSGCTKTKPGRLQKWSSGVQCFPGMLKALDSTPSTHMHTHTHMCTHTYTHVYSLLHTFQNSSNRKIITVKWFMVSFHSDERLTTSKNNSCSLTRNQKHSLKRWLSN